MSHLTTVQAVSNCDYITLLASPTWGIAVKPVMTYVCAVIDFGAMHMYCKGVHAKPGL